MRTENDVIDSRIEINLVDFLAQLLYRWKLVLSLVIAGIVLLSCLWVIKSRKQRPAEEISVSRIAQAKENMSDEQIEHVDYVYSQYLSYKNYRRSLQDYLSSSLYDSSDFEDNIRKETLYCVESDIENINQCFTRLALGVNEYDAIADILGLDNSLYDDVYRRVAIADVNLQNNGEGGNIVIQESDQKVLTKNILDVYIVAPTIEQADKISEVIEKSFDTLIQKLLEYDGRLQFSEIDHTYKTNIADFIYSRQTNLVNNLNQVNTAIDELETKYVNKMSSDERAYYNQIKERDELIVAPVKRLSLKKYLAIGFLLGLFVAILFVFLRYIFDGSIKTAGELSRIYSLPVLYSVNQSNKGTNFFSAIARRLKRATISDQTTYTGMISADLKIRIQKLGLSSVYIVLNEKEDSGVKEMVDEIKTTLEKGSNSISIETGNPLDKPEKLEQFSEKDAVLFIAKLKRTNRSMFRRWVQLSKRYEMNTLGVITLEEC